MEIEYPIGGFAPGNYLVRCTNCKERFTGDKRAVQCEPCAINALKKNNIEAVTELNKLRTKIKPNGKTKN